MKNKFAEFVNDEENSIKISCFVERESYLLSQHREIDVNQLCYKGVCKKERNMFAFIATGLIFTSNGLLCVFPKTYNIPSSYEQIIEHIQILTSVLMRYKDESKFEPEEYELLSGEGTSEKYNLPSALWLMKDYIENGLIKRDFTTTRNGGNGVVNWNKTINSITPVISNRRPVYVDFVVKKKYSDINNILCKLHYLAVQKSFEKYGWIIGKNDEEMSHAKANEQFSENTIDIILKKELSMTNVDREIQLIKMIRQFLIGSTQEQATMTVNTFATPFFHRVWEIMCGNVFGNEYKMLKKYVPKPIWFIGGKQVSTVQLPDILFVENDCTYILDAKYYDTTKTLPGWHDLVKQFFYSESIKITNQRKINVLVFPIWSDSMITYIGYNKMDSGKDFGRIEGVGVNLYEMLLAYGKYKNVNIRKQLYKVLE